MSDKVSGGANSRSSLRVILRKSRVECIWSGLPQIASVYADIAESSVSAISRSRPVGRMHFCFITACWNNGSPSRKGSGPVSSVVLPAALAEKPNNWYSQPEPGSPLHAWGPQYVSPMLED
jgi:hypothetical protein